MSKMGTPVKVVKAGDKSIASAKAEVSIASVAGKKVEPEAQLVEVEPGVYDITFTCSCGERTVLRCSSLDNSSKPIPTPAPAPQPAVKSAAAPVMPSVLPASAASTKA